MSDRRHILWSEEGLERGKTAGSRYESADPVAGLTNDFTDGPPSIAPATLYLDA